MDSTVIALANLLQALIESLEAKQQDIPALDWICDLYGRGFSVGADPTQLMAVCASASRKQTDWLLRLTALAREFRLEEVYAVPSLARAVAHALRALKHQPRGPASGDVTCSS